MKNEDLQVVTYSKRTSRLHDSAVLDSLWVGRSGNRIRVEVNFPHPYRETLKPNQSPTKGVKWSGRGIDHPPPSSAEVKERAKLYLYSPSVFL